MLRPDYSIALDSGTLTTATFGPLVALEVRRRKNGGADEAVIFLGRVPDVDPSEGAPVTIELGWDGGTTLVFTGSIDAIERGIGRMEVFCLGNQDKLARARTDKAFINQAAGEVISALAGDAGIDTDTMEDGINLPVYLADSSLRVYDHCLGLARRCGFDLYTTQEGKLVFSKFASYTAAHTFRYGEHILGASIEKGIPLEKVTVVPERPASSSGDDTASWLIKDPSPHRGEAGSDKNNYECDVRLRDTGLELHRVPVATQRIGLAGIPNVDDLVLVQFVGGDLHGAVITGRLYNDADRPPEAKAKECVYSCPDDAESGIRRAYMEFPNGNTLLLDDDKVVVEAGDTTLTIKNSGDVEIKSNAKVVIQSQGNTEIKSQGDISIDAGGGLTMKAQTDVKIEGLSVSAKGQTTAQIEGQASTTVKGPMISIAGMTSFSPG